MKGSYKCGHAVFSTVCNQLLRFLHKPNPEVRVPKLLFTTSCPQPAKPLVDPTSVAAATELLPYLRLPRTTGIHESCCEGTQGGLPWWSIWGPHWPVHQPLPPHPLGLLPHRCSQAGGTEPSPSAGVLPPPPNQEHLCFRHI